MFSKMQNFWSQHRQKFLLGGAFVGGVVLLSHYAQKALREWQERETKELLERARKQQHYESIERTCNQTALTLAPTLKNTISNILKTEELIQKLKVGAENKILIWEELKILSFTKISVLVYASSLLIVALRIQLNLIGGYMFCDTSCEYEENQITSGIQEKYLGLCQFFVEEGAKKLCSLIEEKVNLVIYEKSLKEKLTINDIEQIFWAIQSSISNDARDPCKNLAKFILPDTVKQESHSANFQIFNKIITETNDLLESDEIIQLTGSCISCGFSHVMDQVADYFLERCELQEDGIVQNHKHSMPSSSLNPHVMLPVKPKVELRNVNKVSIPMAKVIPIVNGLVQNHSCRDDVPHTWIQLLILMDSLKVMGANIYETFSTKG